MKTNKEEKIKGYIRFTKSNNTFLLAEAKRKGGISKNLCVNILVEAAKKKHDCRKG